MPVSTDPTAPQADDTDQRPDFACCLHRPPDEGYPWKLADEGYVTCGDCLLRIRSIMRDVRSRYERLDSTPGRGGDGSRGAPGFASRSPASDHVIAFKDPRSSQTARTWIDRAGRLCLEDERPPVSVRGELDILAWDVAEQLGHDGPDDRADVGDLLAWIDRHLDAITRDAGLSGQVAFTLRALQSTLKPLTGEPRPRYIGHCPAPTACADDELPEWVARTTAGVASLFAWCSALLATRDPGWIDDVLIALDALVDPGVEPMLLDADGAPARRCGARLYAPVKGDEVRCRACRARWARADWWSLGEALQTAA